MSRLVEEALAAVDGVIQHAMPEFEHLFSPEGTTMEDAVHDVLHKVAWIIIQRWISIQNASDELAKTVAGHL